MASVTYRPDGPEMKPRLETLVREMMIGLMTALDRNPFDLDDLNSKQAFHTLLPELIFRAARVERRFMTRFGRLWEKVARLVGEDVKGYAVNGKKIEGTLGSDRSTRIGDVMEGRLPGTPNWEAELAHVLEGNGEPKSIEVTCDVFISTAEDAPGVAFELKSPKPNRDQALAARRRLLTLYAMEPKAITDAYFGLPYNPYGARDQYEWPHIRRFFDVKNDPRLLIGDELWEVLGRKEVFGELMEVIREIDTEFHRAIYDRCLQLPWPDDTGGADGD